MLILAVACSSLPDLSHTATETVIPDPTRTPVPTHVFKASTEPIDAFEPNEVCPDVCWLGIRPGTSVKWATLLLKNSRDIREIRTGYNEMWVEWFPLGSGDNAVTVLIQSSDNIVTSISLINVRSFTVGDMLALWGEPEQIEINGGCYHEGVICPISYQVQYSLLDIILSIESHDHHGPAPHDSVREINISVPVKNPLSARPWLGYGHLDEYLQNLEVPTLTPDPVH